MMTRHSAPPHDALVAVSPDSFATPCTSDEGPERHQRLEKDHASLKRAAALILEGQVVAMPTETVYGLAANALDQEAVSRIYKIKGRPSDNPLIIHVSSMAMLQGLYEPSWEAPPSYSAAIEALWPGPLTILLPRSPKVAPAVTCGLETMAVRMPAHPVALALIEACGVPLAAPSANSSGRPSPTTASHVMDDLFGQSEAGVRGCGPAMVLDGGPCSCGVESTVLDAFTRSPPAILRPGGATFEQLFSLDGLRGLTVYVSGSDKGLEASPSTPGMKYKHYSPTARVILVEPSSSTDDLCQRCESQVNILISDASFSGRIAVIHTNSGGTSSFSNSSRVVEMSLGGGDAAQVARGLFAALREVDKLQVQVVVVEGMREENEGMAVMNRLRKAASLIV
jgi:L-threonylcarbamoyladenylate synthase